MREPGPRSFASLALLARLALTTLWVAPLPAAAQAGLGHLEDATLAPRGMLRFRAITAWTRYDSRFAPAGVEPLGARFTSDSLDGRRVAGLGVIDSLIEAASASPFALSLGRSRVHALAREEVVPIGLEYGITNRLTVGVIVPIVRRRVAVQFQLDSNGANVGPNRHRSSASVQQTNALVQTQFATAATQLQSRLQACQASPTSAGCPALLARQAEAQQLIVASQGFAGAVAELYGSGTSAGMPFVPVNQSAGQLAVEMRVADFNARYRDLLGSSTDVISTVPLGAGGPAGTSQFQNFLSGELQRDSIASQERSGIGDIEVGLKTLVIDRPMTDARRVGTQLSVHAGVRLPTGSRQSPSELADLRLGNGLLVDGRVAWDVQAGRAGLLAVGDAAFAPEDTAALRDSRSLGIHVAPRWHVTPPLSIHGAFSVRSANRSGTQQFVGGGVSFSTLSMFRANGGPLPVEMRFTHLEAIGGAAGQPKYFRDQIELRLYYRLIRR